MITTYQIKEIQGREVLLLQLNFDFEFGLFQAWKENSLDLYQKVKEFLQKNKINFKGHLIHIIVSGIVVGSILLSGSPNLTVENIPANEYQYISKVFIPDSTTAITEKTVEEIVIEPSADTEVIEVILSEPTSITKEPIASSNTPTKNANSSASHTQVPKQENKNTEALESPKETIKEEAPKESTILVTIYRSSGVVQQLPLEEYVIGVVAGEMPAAFPSQALEAQAIVARTYAMKRMSENKILTDTVSTQVYKDTSQMKSLWGSTYQTYYSKVVNAVTKTKGQVLTYQGKYIDAVYHSTNNGKTENSKDVFGNYFPYLVSVNSPWDKEAPSYLREQTNNLFIINQILGTNITENSIIAVTKTTDGGNIDTIQIDGIDFNGIFVREKIGLRSADFDLKIDKDEITFTMRGYGHGVGMSQYGARGMANAGYTANQIVTHYYPGVQLTTIK